MRLEYFLVFLVIILIFLPLTNSSSAEGYSLDSVFGKYMSNSQMSAPTGIASYGIDKTDGEWILDKIITKGIEGRVTINSLDAYNPDPANPSTNQQLYMNNGEIHGANLQLNAFLFVHTTTGEQIFWLQNTNRFDIQDQQVNSPRDLILNRTGGGVCNPLYEYGGNGKVNPPCPNPPQRFYTFGDPFQPYQLPMNMSNGIYIKPIIGKGVAIFFYNKPFGNGIFDKVLLPITNIVDANIVSSPRLPNRSFHGPSDVEYVWTGFTGGEKTTFKSMDSYMHLSYMGNDTKLQPFPSLFTFGTETAEKVTNLQVTLSDHGPHVEVGTQNNGFLEEINRQASSVPLTTDQNNAQVNPTPIPSWIKNNAKWWSQGQVSDEEFVKGVQYLVQNGIIQIPQTQTTSGGSQQIPQWVKNTAGWWADGQVSDDEFVKAVQYMISSGIITIQ